MKNQQTRLHNTRQKNALIQAQTMQDNILPNGKLLENVVKNQKLGVATYFEPCQMPGGDFWGIEVLYCDHVGFYIVDCSGHGFNSALNAFRLHAMIEDITNMYVKLKPSQMLRVLNQKMHKLLPTGQFATMFYGVMNTKKGEVTYAAAGSMPPIMLKKNGKVKLLDSSGFPLGAVPDADFAMHMVKFQKGDKLVLYSDALVESIDSKGKMMGEAKLLKLLEKHAALDGNKLLEKILQKQASFRPDDSLHDDLTINIYTRL